MHKEVVWSAAFSPDGKILASGGVDNPPMLWDLRTGKLLRELNGPKSVTGVDFSPDGSLLASIGHNVYTWAVASGKRQLRLKVDPEYIGPVHFSCDGKTLAYGGSDEDLILRDVRTGGVKYVLYGYIGFSFAFSPDGRTLAAVCWGRAVRFWDIRTGKRLRTRIDWRRTGNVYSIAFSPDGKLIATGGEKMTLRGRGAGSRAPEAGVVMISDARTGKELWRTSLADTRVWSVAFSPDGKLLAAGFDNGIVKVWRIRYIEKPDPR